MKVIFKDEALEELYNTGETKKKKYKKLCRDKQLVRGYAHTVETIRDASCIQELRLHSYLHYEKLKYRPESSIRIVNGRVERLIFTEKEDGIEVELIEIDSTHYGNR